MTVREAIQQLIQWDNLNDPLMYEIDCIDNEGYKRKVLAHGEVSNITVGYGPCIRIRNPKQPEEIEGNATTKSPT